jgi:hypothetical protein
MPAKKSSAEAPAPTPVELERDDATVLGEMTVHPETVAGWKRLSCVVKVDLDQVYIVLHHADENTAYDEVEAGYVLMVAARGCEVAARVPVTVFLRLVEIGRSGAADGGVQTRDGAAAAAWPSCCPRSAHRD